MKTDNRDYNRLATIAMIATAALTVVIGCSSNTGSNSQNGNFVGFAGSTANSAQQAAGGNAGSSVPTGSAGQAVTGAGGKLAANSGAAGKSPAGTGTGGKGGAKAVAGKSGGAAGATATKPHGTTTCLKPGSGEYGEPGPYRTARKANIDLASFLPSGTATPTTFTVIYPDPLEENCPHPIVAWGNGTGVTGEATYDFFNNNGASWGLVVIASDNSNTGSGDYHKAGIDYLLKENENPESIFYRKLSTRAGTTGHSQGGMGATVASAHPNVEAEVCVAGGGLLGAKVAFICLTGTADMVEATCTATYNAAPGPAFLADWEGGDHVTTETLAGYMARNAGTLQMQRLYAAWFRCFLADDPVACAMFKGTPCGMCNEPGWSTISNRNM